MADFFPSNAFMASARSFNTLYGIAKALISKLTFFFSAPQMADSPFLKALGTPTIRTAPAQTGELAQRAVEEWERNVCENKAVAILNKMQEGKTALIKKDGGEMLIAIELDKPLSEAQALVDDPDAFMLEITKIIQNKHAHPVVA